MNNTVYMVNDTLRIFSDPVVRDWGNYLSFWILISVLHPIYF